MRLRNGKRGYDETIKSFEQDKIKKQQLEEYIKNRDGLEDEETPNPSSRRVSVRNLKPKKQKQLTTRESFSTAEEWSANNLKNAKILYNLYEDKLEKADKNSDKLWKCNGKLEKVFMKKIMELSKKEGASQRSLGKIKTNIEIYEKEEDVLKKEQDMLFKKNKKLELEAKRAFVNSKRAASGEYLTELEESTMRYRKNANVNEDKYCAICVDEIGKSRSVMTQECKHYFHEDCFDSWMELSSTCPMCRSFLEPAIKEISLSQNEGGFGRIHDVNSWASTTATNTR